MSSVASSSKPKKTKTSKPTTRKRKPPVNGAAGRKVSVFDAGLMDWQTTGKDGLSLKIVREDKEKGLFLGAVGFEPMVRSGLHQHLGVATSFFAAGGLTDYSGSAKQNDFGINLKGATHDAVTYEKTVLISRLE